MPTVTANVVSQLQRSIARAIYGKEDVIQLALITLLAKGHLLIEDVPGVGKDNSGPGIGKIVSLHLPAHSIYQRPPAKRCPGSKCLQS